MGWTDALRNLEGFSGDRLYGEPLSKHTYFKIGGPATALAVPKSEGDLRLLAKLIASENVPYAILGLGSNLLVRDEGLDLLCLKTTKLPGAAAEEGDGIRAGAGIAVAAFLRKAADSGWDGFEAISGIPGTLGGVVAMNGGTHLGEAADLLLEVRTFDLRKPEAPLRARGRDELKFSYRKNHFLEPGEIVVDAKWKLVRGDSATIREKLDSLYRRRKETQPLDFPSCGSVFKNPKESGLRAWEVVEKLGLRGHRIGNAQIAEKHPNWILNLGDAKARDVIALIELVKSRAAAELGVTMVEEVRIL
ncbi:MAG: UDP-N-acetylmuramate dehydrogenase [Bdellovibrionales bacterium]|nr:UDP-N-acetylmuramate dehydrogenase [Bdellovibrionales bacterium]